MTSRDLYLPCNSGWFDHIKQQIEKTGSAIEYRPCSPHWVTRIEGKQFDRVILVRGRHSKVARESAPWGVYQMDLLCGKITRQPAPPTFAPYEGDLYLFKLSRIDPELEEAIKASSPQAGISAQALASSHTARRPTK